MNTLRWLAVLLALPLIAQAAERILKADPARSFVEVDVKATVDSFTARLDKYELAATIDDKNRIKTGVLTFKFADLKTGKPDRDEAMLEWLGSPDAAGKYALGILAVTPDGQGQVTGNLTFHDKSGLVEFPVNVNQAGGTYTITGEASVDYRNWGLKKIRKMGLLTVNPVVKVRFKFVGEPVAAPPPAK